MRKWDTNCAFPSRTQEKAYITCHRSPCRATKKIRASWMKKCLHIVTMSCKKRHHYARGWCFEVMDATRLEIVHVSSAANFATTPASKNQVILHPLGPCNGACVIAPTGPRQWCRRYCTHWPPAMVQALLHPLDPGTGAGVIASPVASTSPSTSGL